ncbi:uncharacterized protein LOC27207666 [Drosophila simulans]|uniref:uncharacterized protein LOC27207666 n=1 Tax=Drosophila simulans TaxID=7240 RepID=UPI00078AE51F|nr:uncharacterized protein LOC27207666 [Drosophila simulans]KMZ09684.1 uncharacterized protein Dsimw501_GD27817 [Drosophila simulans]
MQCEREAGGAAGERDRAERSGQCDREGARAGGGTLLPRFVSCSLVAFCLFVFICRVCGSAERGVGDDAGRGGSVGSGTQRRKCKAKRVRKRGSDGGRERERLVWDRNRLHVRALENLTQQSSQGSCCQDPPPPVHPYPAPAH